MADIRNSISMTDRMTPTLRSIMKSMDSMMRVMQRLDKQSNNGKQSKAYRQAEKDIKRANNALIKMRNYTDMAGDSASKASSKYRRMSSSVNSAAIGMRSLGSSSSMFLQSLASGVYLAQKLANVVGDIMEVSDASRSQVARLGLYNTSQYTSEELYGKVFSTAMSTRSGLSETADLANKILVSGVYKGSRSAEAAIGTADLINKALVAGGGTQEENQRALRQLTQGLSSGVLQGDELRSIREQTPYFAQVLAEGLSKIDERFEGIGIGDLKELGSEGELTADRIVKAMWAMQDEINADFKQMPKTFGQAMTSLSNIWQYFLYLLSDTEGPLGKINNAIWKFVDYLQSPQGFELMNTVAMGIDMIASGIVWLMTKIGDFVVFLQENSNVAKAIFAALAIAAVVAAVSAISTWVAAAWPILLIIALVGVLVYVFLEAGYTMSEIVGAVCGAIMFAIAVIWDAIILLLGIIMWVLVIIAEAVVAVGAGIILIVQSIAQVILWAITTIYATLMIIWDVIYTIAKGAWGVVKGAIVGIYALFVGLSEGVLGILYAIASAIDWVFGSNLSDTVGGWMDGLAGSVSDLNNALDPLGEFEDIGTQWTTSFETIGDMYSGSGKYDDLNITDNMADVWNGTGNIMGNIWDFGLESGEFLYSGMQNPMDWWNSGYDWGEGLVNGIGDFDLSLPSDSVLGIDRLSDGLNINGGNLDSVGSINSDIDLSDEDIQLLRDMSARDYLLQVQSITPVANVTFGDVRETADVNKIVEVIETMVDEQMATALVS